MAKHQSREVWAVPENQQATMEWRLPRSWLVDGLSGDLRHFLNLLLVLQDFRHLLLFFSTILWCLPSSVAFLKFSFSGMLWCPDLPLQAGFELFHACKLP